MEKMERKVDGRSKVKERARDPKEDVLYVEEIIINRSAHVIRHSGRGKGSDR